MNANDSRTNAIGVQVNANASRTNASSLPTSASGLKPRSIAKGRMDA